MGLGGLAFYNLRASGYFSLKVGEGFRYWFRLCGVGVKERDYGCQASRDLRIRDFAKVSSIRLVAGIAVSRIRLVAGIPV